MASLTGGTFTSRKAAADLSAATKEWSLVKTDANGNVVPTTAKTDAVLGVLENTVVQNDTASVGLIDAGGVLKVRVGSVSIAKDALLMSDANGLAITSDAVANTICFGRALEAGVAGQVISFVPFYRFF